MFRAALCSSSGGQLYEYNFWYSNSVSVAVRYVGRDMEPELADRNGFSVFISYLLPFFPPFTSGLFNYAVSSSNYTSVER
jgi:hypothetical protein